VARLAIFPVLIFVVLSASSGSAFAQEELTHRGEVYALASGVASDAFPREQPQHQRTAGGFRLGGAWKPTSSFGLVSDVGRYAASNSTNSFSFTTIQFGARLYGHETLRTSGFLHMMGGANRFALANAAGVSAHWHPMWEFGAGFDVRLRGGFVFRAAEADLLLSGSNSQGPLGGRLSSGFAYRFGQH
jgi:hypothetical protein